MNGDAPIAKSCVRQAFALATTYRRRVRGFLGSAPSSRALLLCPCRDVHTFGMRYCLDIAFVDARGVVIRSARAVPPGRRLCCRGACAVIERAARTDEPWFEVGSSLVLGVGTLRGTGPP